MKITEMMALTDEQLHELSMQKNKKGCATQDALRAQKLIWERAGEPFSHEERMEYDDWYLKEVD